MSLLPIEKSKTIDAELAAALQKARAEVAKGDCLTEEEFDFSMDRFEKAVQDRMLRI